MIDNYVFSCMHFGVEMVEISCIVGLNFNIRNGKCLESRHSLRYKEM